MKNNVGAETIVEEVCDSIQGLNQVTRKAS